MKKARCPNAQVSANPVKQGFSMKAIPANLDVIIIGSGMGGLTTAALLAKEGKKVLVLEQHDVAGGNTHTFVDQGYEFDTGLHYVGGKIGDKNSSLRRQLDYVTDGQVEWEQMDDAYDVAMIESDKERFNFYSSWTKLKQHLKEKFPDDGVAIDDYFALVKRTTNLFPVLVVLKFLPESVFRFSMWLFGAKMFNKTTNQVLEKLTKNRKLMGVLSYMYGDYGEVPSRGAFTVHALIASHYRGGAYYPVGGPLEIAISAAKVIERWGGKVLVRAPVSSVLIDDNNQAYGVVVKGNKILAKTIVSSVGAPKTFTTFVPESHRHLVSKQIDIMRDPKIASNVSLMTMFVGINDPDSSLKLPKCNYWIHRSWDLDSNMDEFRKDHTKIPAFFISFSSAKDPTYATRNPGKQVALVIAPSDFAHVEEFQHDRVKRRSKKYIEMKKEWEKKFVEVLLDQFPELHGKIDYVDFGSAVTNDYYLGTHRGAVYGLAHTPERLMQHWLRPQTPIKNLFLNGQDVCTCGITGALIGGFFAAYAISPKCLLRTVSMF